MRSTPFSILVRAVACVFAGALLVAPALAQTAPPRPRLAKLRFLFLDETAGHYDLKLAQDDYLRISAGPYEVSAPYQPSVIKPLEIYKTSPTNDPVTGLPSRLKIASLTPPASTVSSLVIVTPRPAVDAATPPVYKVEFIDCDPTAFPAGAVRVINRGKTTLGTQFGSTRATTEPGATNILRPTTDKRHRVFFKIAVQNPDKPSGWQLLQDSLTVIPPNHRLFGILVFSPSGMKHTLTPAELAEFGPPSPGHFWLTFSDTP